MDVREIDRRAARQLVEERHYLHRKPPVSYSFGLFIDDNIMGVITFGVPASHHLRVSLCKKAPEKTIELNRLWVDDRMPRNTESQFISKALSKLPALIIVSYADTMQGHAGYVYRASNFFYAGLTDADRKTPRFDYVPRNGKHSRDAFRSGLGEFDRVRRQPKHKYWTVTGNRKEKKQLIKLCDWPSLKWIKSSTNLF